jgi:hypothetical protein
MRQQMDLGLSWEMPMLAAAAVGAGCDAGPVPERSAECWLGLVAHVRGDLGVPALLARSGRCACCIRQ